MFEAQSVFRARAQRVVSLTIRCVSGCLVVWMCPCSTKLPLLCFHASFPHFILSLPLSLTLPLLSLPPSLSHRLSVSSASLPLMVCLSVSPYPPVGMV